MDPNKNIELKSIDLIFPYWHLLTSEQKHQLEHNLNIIKYNKKDILFRQNSRTSHVMFINSGLVKIYKQGRNDRQIIARIATPGTWLGLMSVFGSNLYQVSASTLTEAEVFEIDTAVFKNIIIDNGRYALYLLKVLSQDSLYIFDKLLSQSRKQLPGRIADVILYFSQEVYKSDTFLLPLTRKELAAMAGTTKESFIRTLKEFKNDKIIELEGSRVKIISIDIIKTLSALG